MTVQSRVYYGCHCFTLLIQCLAITLTLVSAIICHDCLVLKKTGKKQKKMWRQKIQHTGTSQLFQIMCSSVEVGIPFSEVSFIKTLVPFRFLPCFDKAAFCFWLTNFKRISGLSVSLLLGSGRQISTFFVSWEIPLDSKNSFTCFSTELMSWLSDSSPAVTACSHDQGLIFQSCHNNIIVPRVLLLVIHSFFGDLTPVDILIIQSLHLSHLL